MDDKDIGVLMRWGAVFALILLGWSALFAMAALDDLRQGAALYGADFWRSLCNITPDAAGYLRIFGMWALMSLAMMLPTILPALRCFEDLSARGATSAGLPALLAGYGAVWLVFSALAAGLQLALFQIGAVDPLGQSASRWLTVGLLVLAGAYQFSAWKDACLRRCQAPFVFFMRHWDEGAWRNGLRLGADCLGCCWALMLLAFVGGMTNLLWMGAAMLFMTLEKLPDLGRYLHRPAGFTLLAIAVYVAST